KNKLRWTGSPAPVNSHHSNATRAHGRLVQCAALFLFFLPASFASARAGEGTPPVSNSPTIFYVTRPQPEVTNGLGYWIWDKATSNKQTVRLWHRFEIPKTNPVVRAELRIAADNAFKVWLDGQELGSGSD